MADRWGVDERSEIVDGQQIGGRWIQALTDTSINVGTLVICSPLQSLGTRAQIPTGHIVNTLRA